MIGYDKGWLGVFDLQKHQTLKNIQCFFTHDILSIAFSRDNQHAFTSIMEENIKMIKWKSNASTKNEFDFTEKPQNIGDGFISSLCLTKDEKYLLVGASKLLRLYETETRKVTKEFEMTGIVVGMSLIKDYKKAIIAEQNGNLYILDLETMEICSIAKNITDDRELRRMIVV